MRARGRLRPVLSGLVAVAALAGLLVWEALATRPVRKAVQTYTELLVAANRQDLDRVHQLCSARYLRKHRPRAAREGGVVGLPRNIHKNFRAWRHGRDVWLCPTNRVGPVFQFVPERGDYLFDGPVGLLTPGGRVEPLEESPVPDDDGG